MTPLQRDRFLICCIYLFIALCGGLTWWLFPTDSDLYAFLAADLVMTVVCFIISRWKRNSSVYDAYWSVIPFLLVLLLSILYRDGNTWYHWLTFGVVSLWSWRLTFNWARGWHGFGHEDWRYVDLARQTGSLYPLVDFLGIHLFPTALVFGGLWPLFYVWPGTVQYGGWCVAGIGVSLLGTWLEYTADNQLAAFRRRPHPRVEELLDTGIWARCRHPNYLGELLFWAGLFLIGQGFGAPWYTVAGTVAMVLLFVGISIPMKEKRMAARRPGYAAYRAAVPLLIPKLF